jgi:hypothetical protein
MDKPEESLWRDKDEILATVAEGASTLFLETDTYRVSKVVVQEVPTLTYVLATSVDYIGAIRTTECRSRFMTAAERLLEQGIVTRLGPDTAMFYYPTPGDPSRFLYEYGFACDPETDAAEVAQALPLAISRGTVRVKSVRGCSCASIIFVGSPLDIGHARRALHRQVISAELPMLGTHAREIYHHVPAPDSQECITELLMAVLPSPSAGL